MLTASWPVSEGPAFYSALESCNPANLGKLDWQIAKTAFIEAAVEAGIPRHTLVALPGSQDAPTIGEFPVTLTDLVAISEIVDEWCEARHTDRQSPAALEVTRKLVLLFGSGLKDRDRAKQIIWPL